MIGFEFPTLRIKLAPKVHVHFIICLSSWMAHIITSLTKDARASRASLRMNQLAMRLMLVLTITAISRKRARRVVQLMTAILSLVNGRAWLDKYDHFIFIKHSMIFRLVPTTRQKQ